MKFLFYDELFLEFKFRFELRYRLNVTTLKVGKFEKLELLNEIKFDVMIILDYFCDITLYL